MIVLLVFSVWLCMAMSKHIGLFLMDVSGYKASGMWVRYIGEMFYEQSIIAVLFLMVPFLIVGVGFWSKGGE